VQLLAPHTTSLLAFTRQAPTPSHWPSALQEFGYPESVGHLSFGSLSAGTFPHVPLAPCSLSATLQATHAPSHAWSQQNPSTQKPLAHTAQLPAMQSAFTSHAVPWLFFVRHWPLTAQ
jgi:hypothetical protein